MKTLIILMSLISSLAFADESIFDKADNIPNSIDQNKPSIAFLARAFDGCVKRQVRSGLTRGQSTAKCSCAGEWSYEHMKMNMTRKQSDEVKKQSESHCDKWLARITISEGS